MHLLKIESGIKTGFSDCKYIQALEQLEYADSFKAGGLPIGILRSYTRSFILLRAEVIHEFKNLGSLEGRQRCTVIKLVDCGLHKLYG